MSIESRVKGCFQAYADQSKSQYGKGYGESGGQHPPGPDRREIEAGVFDRPVEHQAPAYLGGVGQTEKGKACLQEDGHAGPLNEAGYNHGP